MERTIEKTKNGKTTHIYFCLTLIVVVAKRVHIVHIIIPARIKFTVQFIVLRMSTPNQNNKWIFSIVCWFSSDLKSKMEIFWQWDISYRPIYSNPWKPSMGWSEYNSHRNSLIIFSLNFSQCTINIYTYLLTHKTFYFFKLFFLECTVLQR